MQTRTKGTRTALLLKEELDGTVNIFCSVTKTSPTLKPDADTVKVFDLLGYLYFSEFHSNVQVSQKKKKKRLP